MRIILVRIACILFFLFLLLHPETAVSGASAGLLLWYQTILPTLLPAMILADLLLRIHADVYLTRLLHRPLELLFHCSRGGSYAVLIGMLSGYPMGAKTTQSLYDRGQITLSEAAHLLHFCNQPSPMFLIGYVSLRMLSQGDPVLHRRILPLVLLSVYGSAWICSLLSHLTAEDGQSGSSSHHYISISGQSECPYPHFAAKNKHAEDLTSHSMSKNTYTENPGPHRQQKKADKKASSSCSAPEKEKGSQKTTDASFLSLLEQSMMTSFEVLVKIGGYMILFSILEAFLSGVPMPSQTLRVLVSGMLEMTTGIQTAAGAFGQTKGAALCCMIVSFGGFSGYAQTRNVMSPILNRQCRYLSWKLLQGILAYVLLLLLSAGGRLILGHFLPG